MAVWVFGFISVLCVLIALMLEEGVIKPHFEKLKTAVIIFGVVAFVVAPGNF